MNWNCSYNAAGQLTCSKPKTVEHFAQIPGNKLNMDQRLNVGDYMFSQDGKFILIYQPDGNLVLYPKAVWSASVTNKDPGYAIMQQDGNFVLYDKFNKPYWATSTVIPGGSFQFQINDSTLNIVNLKDSNKSIWKSPLPVYIKTKIKTLDLNNTRISISNDQFLPLKDRMLPGERFRFVQHGTNPSSYYNIVSISQPLTKDMYQIVITPQIILKELPKLNIDTYFLFDT